MGRPRAASSLGPPAAARWARRRRPRIPPRTPPTDGPWFLAANAQQVAVRLDLPAGATWLVGDP
eukprot:5180255-Alexandrium_andersonii.AAC.1